MSPNGPRLPTWAVQQVGSYLGYAAGFNPMHRPVVLRDAYGPTQTSQSVSDGSGAGGQLNSLTTLAK